VNEVEFYEALTGQVFESEYGEWMSARRRGRKFEDNLHQNNAAILRRALAPRFGYDPESCYVRNLVDEIPDHVANAHRRRYERTARIFADMAADCEPPAVPHLLIEPQLRLQVDDNRFIYVAPDFAVFDSQARCYVIGEEKSMIVRDGSPDRADLDRTRRQAGAEVLALRLLCEQPDLDDRLRNRANFIFASPFGVSPHNPVEEDLHAEASEMQRAIESYRRVSTELRRFGGQVSANQLASQAQEYKINFQNTCMSSCALFSYCKNRISNTAQVLGEEAGDAFGATTELDRLYELMRNPDRAGSAEDVTLAARLREAMMVLGVGANTTEERLSIV
jgi:hypothetical protein